MASVFTKIINGEIPCHKIAESEHCLAFLDISPLAEGHTLVIPKKEIDYYFDLDDDLFSKLNLFAKDVARGIEKVIRCQRIGVAIIGLEVPHAHIHLVPLQNIHGIDFSKPKLQFSIEEMSKIASLISDAIQLSGRD